MRGQLPCSVVDPGSFSGQLECHHLCSCDCMNSVQHKLDRGNVQQLQTLRVVLVLLQRAQFFLVRPRPFLCAAATRRAPAPSHSLLLLPPVAAHPLIRLPSGCRHS